jgi:predicted dehydrogenase
MTYQWVTSIDSLHLADKSVILIGAGSIADAYAAGLRKLQIKDVTVISRDPDKTAQFCAKHGFKPVSGGFEKNLASAEKADLVIITTQEHMLANATAIAIESGQHNILVEKPVSIDHKKILSLAGKIRDQKVRVAYNRLLYPNFYKLKELVEEEGGATSCRYTFTEWPHLFDFVKYNPNIFRYAGITDCLHPITMAHELIGMPSELNYNRLGKLDWHPSGSIFTGSGVTGSGVPFSYHADWESAGRWSIEIMTRMNAYRLMPLEDLYVCHKASVNWEKVPFKVAFPDVKQGIAEEVASMLDGSKGRPEPMKLERAAEYNRLAEKIFGYSPSP